MSVESWVHARPSAILRNTWSLCLRGLWPLAERELSLRRKTGVPGASLRTAISEWGWKGELEKDPQISCWRDKRRTRHHNGNWGRGRGDDYHDWGLNWHRGKEWERPLGRIWWQKPGPWWETEQAEAVQWAKREEKTKKYDHSYWLIFID